jgi:glutamine synthetase
MAGLRTRSRLRTDRATRSGSHVIPRYLDLTREEWLEYREQVTTLEIDRYLPLT